MDIDKAFSSAFSLLFGECNVTLSELAPYLLKYQPKAQHTKSSQSSRPTTISGANYDARARFISQDEIDFSKKPAPISINEIKDIDSVIDAVRERAIYCGNKVFGNCSEVKESDNVTDSFFVNKSHIIHSSKYVSHSSYIHDASEYIFGSSWLGRGKFLIRVMNALDLTRSFECYSSGIGSDMFCTFNCLDCSDVMFSFNLKAKRNAIGNLELPRKKYFALKKKLIEEARQYIEKHKEFPTIFEFAGAESLPSGMPAALDIKKRAPYDRKPIEDAWRSVSKLVLGSHNGWPCPRLQPRVQSHPASAMLGMPATSVAGSPPIVSDIGGLEECRAYLTENTHKTGTVKTAYCSEVYYGDVFFFPAIPKKRMASHDEATELSRITLPEEDLSSLESILKNINKIAFYRVNFEGGNASNNACTAIAYNSLNAYEVFDSTVSKNNAFCTMALESSYCFGCYRVVHCDFCIRCHNCTGCIRCVEMDCCTSCADSAFCHNCENVRDSLFCFNTKNLRYAIGNTEVGREKFMAAKQALLSYLRKKIAAKERVPSIYDIGAAKK